MKTPRIINLAGAALSAALFVAFCIMAWLSGMETMWIIMATAAYIPVFTFLMAQGLAKDQAPADSTTASDPFAAFPLITQQPAPAAELRPDVQPAPSEKTRMEPSPAIAAAQKAAPAPADSSAETAAEWSRAMYERYVPVWNNYFDTTRTPADKAAKAELTVMLWNIASATIDYLKAWNQDPNTLSSNTEMMRAILERRDIPAGVKLKEYYNDPTTVPEKAVLVGEYIRAQLAVKQTIETAVFGYRFCADKNPDKK